MKDLEVTSDEEDLAPVTSAPQVRLSGYARYLTLLLLCIHTINFVDRSIIYIVAEAIKVDLHLLDWQVGAVSGLAFALLYTFGGLPIARLAERGDRPMIIAGATAIWSLCTALCGAAATFVQLITARVGVGMGEAGLTPPAHSLISDSVPPQRRISAIALYHMGTPLGTLFGSGIGGLVASAYGWRAVFIAAAAPGLVGAALVAATLREPRRALRAAATPLTSASFGAALSAIAGKRTYRLIVAAAVCKAFMGYGAAPFYASFMLRNHLVAVTEMAHRAGAVFGVELKPLAFLGLFLALANGLLAALGSWTGGWIADRLGLADRRAHMIAPIVSTLLAIPVWIAAMLVSRADVALVLLSVNGFLGSMYLGPMFGTAQGLVPPHMRATASALLLFCISLVGLGVGPLAVGATSDLLAHFGHLGSGGGLRWALILLMLVGGAPAAAALWAARRSIREEVVS